MDASFHIPTSKSNTQFVGDENRPPAQPSVDSTVDPYLDDIKNQAGDDESDGEDEDFVAEKDDSRFPTDDSDEEHSDASGSGGEKKEKMPKKEATVSKPSSSKRKAKDGDEAGSKKRPKKKKDPNAPKRGMSGVMFFSNAERENIKKSNPGLAFPEVGKALGEKWKKMSAEEKEPFETMAKADKKRYREQMAGYKSGTAATVNSGNDAS